MKNFFSKITNRLLKGNPHQDIKKNVVLDSLKNSVNNIRDELTPNQKRAAMWSALSSSTTSGFAVETPHVMDKSFGKHLPFLRQLFDISTIDKIIVARRQQQMRCLSDPICSTSTKLGWRITHRHANDRIYRITNEVLEECQLMERLLMNGVNRRIHPNGFKDILSILVHDQLVYDRKALIIQEHKDFPGKPGGFYCVDPITIKPLTTLLWEYSGSDQFSGMSQNERNNRINRALHEISDLINRPLDNVSYAQVIDGCVAQAFTDNEIAIGITNPCNRINGIGWSQGSLFDVSYELSEILLHALGFNREVFDPIYPEILMTIRDESNPTVIKDMMERLTLPGSQRYTKFAVVPLLDAKMDVNLFKLQERAMDLIFSDSQHFYMQLKASAYGMDIAELNINNSVSGGINGNSAITQPGLLSLLSDIADFITEKIIVPWCPDLKMEFVHSRDMVTKVNNELEQEIRNWLTINEARALKNLPPIEHGDFISNPLYLQEKNASNYL